MKKPIFARNLRVHFAGDNTGRNVVHDDEAVDQFGAILDQTGCDPRAAVMSDQRHPPDAERLQELDDIVGHRPLVVTLRRLVGLAVSAQVRSYHPIVTGKRWNLEAPSEAGFRKPVQQDDWRSSPGLKVELSNAVGPARGSPN